MISCEYRILDKLARSKFRSSFKLNERELNYLNKLGYEKIKEHAISFINNRIAPKDIINDGKQTPMKGHPVFIAQHATATCCRNCIYKWYKIPKNRELNSEEIVYLVNIIMKWLQNEAKRLEI